MTKKIITLGKVTVEARTSDNFINATQLCKAGGKFFKDWYRLDSTKNLIKELEKELKLNTTIDSTNLIETTKGRYNSGSWIHPDLAIPLAIWLSPAFGIKVTRWINEWRIYSPENENKYQQALSEITSSDKIFREKDVNVKLTCELNGVSEIKTPAGFIDVMTKDKIIEIKEIRKWKHAVGQILSYGVFVDKIKCIYLYNNCNDTTSLDISVIHRVCKELDIEVMFDK